MESGKIAPTKPVLHNSSLITGIQGLISTFSELVAKVKWIYIMILCLIKYYS